MLKNYANWDSIQYWVLESDFAYPSTGKTSFHKFLCVASKDSSLGSLLIAFLLFMLRSYHYWVSPAPVIRILKYEKHCSKLCNSYFLHWNFDWKSCFVVFFHEWNEWKNPQFNFSSQDLSIERNFFKWDGKVTKISHLLFHRIWKNNFPYFQMYHCPNSQHLMAIIVLVLR